MANKPLEQMTVKELRILQARETDGDFADQFSGLEAFDELARRNKLLVEAIETYRETACGMTIKKLDDAVAAAKGE